MILAPPSFLPAEVVPIQSTQTDGAHARRPIEPPHIDVESARIFYHRWAASRGRDIICGTVDVSVGDRTMSDSGSGVDLLGGVLGPKFGTEMHGIMKGPNGLEVDNPVVEKALGFAAAAAIVVFAGAAAWRFFTAKKGEIGRNGPKVED
jgi:hypothetical protein